MHINTDDNLANIVEQLNEVIERKLAESFEEVQLEDVGLYPRGGRTFWVDEENESCVVIEYSNFKNFEYYCGGEYVGTHAKQIVGGYVIYYAIDAQVKTWIERSLDYIASTIE